MTHPVMHILNTQSAPMHALNLSVNDLLMQQSRRIDMRPDIYLRNVTEQYGRAVDEAWRYALRSTNASQGTRLRATPKLWMLNNDTPLNGRTMTTPEDTCPVHIGMHPHAKETLIKEYLPIDAIDIGRKKVSAIIVWSILPKPVFVGDNNTYTDSRHHTPSPTYTREHIAQWAHQHNAPLRVVCAASWNSVITDDAVLDACETNSIYIGGRPDEDLPVFIPTYTSDTFRCYGVSAATRARQTATGYIELTKETESGTKTVYWFPGYVPANTATTLAIIRTLAHMHRIDAGNLSGFMDVLPEMEYVPEEIHRITREIAGARRIITQIDQDITNLPEQIQRHVRNYQRIWGENHKIKQSPTTDSTGQARIDLQRIQDIDGVDYVTMDKQILYIYTHPLIAHATGNSDRKNHPDIHIGRMAIAIKLNASTRERIDSFEEGIIRMRNMDNACAITDYEVISERHAPHLNPCPCWGNARESINSLYRDKQYPELVMMIIMYLQSYNQDDGWGRSAREWTRASAVATAMSVRG